MEELRREAAAYVSQMTPEEKAALCVGADFWHVRGVERLGLRGIMTADGPHGLRKQVAHHDSARPSDSVPATCFPTASAVACTFDPELAQEMGRAMAEECRAKRVSVLLGPGVNMKRSPLGGRNFEYFSEDPYLAGKLGAAMIRGMQSVGVGASLKHFALNSQESRRMTVDSAADERALRELYLRAFEIAVKEGRP
ncbi:MAG TPA: glycosyl hydrolase, partial [Firmicutes bacterium]|nr:glycosyl hydrolase [Bacillota bacterium]